LKKTTLASLLVIALAGCSAPTAGTASPVPNLAPIEIATARQVTATAREAVEAVFSYDSTKPETQTAAVAKYLTAAASEEMKELFGAVWEAAKTAPMKVDTKAAEVGVATVSADHATLLAFLTQRSANTETGKVSSGVAQLRLDAVREGGSWRISAMKTNPIDKPGPAVVSGLGTGRDTAVAAARSLVADLLYADSADTEGMYARWVAASADPLLSQYRTDRDKLLAPFKAGEVKASVVPDPVCVATSVDATKAEMLVAASVTTSQAAAPATTRVLSLRLSLVRVGEAWKVSALAPVTS
jgi:Mce-associated membrane protein